MLNELILLECFPFGHDEFYLWLLVVHFIKKNGSAIYFDKEKIGRNGSNEPNRLLLRDNKSGTINGKTFIFTRYG